MPEKKPNSVLISKIWLKFILETLSLDKYQFIDKEKKVLHQYLLSGFI
jgi:hypothetical protein